ncbi:hypothetical protein RP20_CCG022021 [Aedes albopictus]|nr:hypothetical protein RP20_CCG022021 [Aedes albopictus]
MPRFAIQSRFSTSYTAVQVQQLTERNGPAVQKRRRRVWQVGRYINGKKSPKSALESYDCIGIVKRYHLCNEQECPDPTVDFREQQCTSFNNQTFQDKRYIWEAFIKDDAECELNCKPIGMRYFATLNKTVIDGTPCSKPTEYFRRNNSGRGICVDGICKVSVPLLKMHIACM